MSNRRTEFLFGVVLILCLVVPVLVACAEENLENNNSPVASAQEGQKHNFKPDEGYVPDADTAITIAVAVWVPIYGEAQIESEKPYHASLEDGTWHVTGSLPEGPGGVAEAEIAKETGCILRISHGE